MIGIAELLLGYCTFTVEEEDVAACAQIFLKSGISIRFSKNTFTADSFKSAKIEKILNGKIEYSKSELKGFGGFLYKNRKRYSVMVSIILSLVLYVISSDRVWDVRIEGCDANFAKEVIAELESCGFSIGTRWSETDVNELEVEVLSKSETVSWLNINRHGTVAYVSVLEKQVHEEEKKAGYSNIVASCDAVIEEITVIHGVANVKVGDSVKKGDLLISGVLPSELGGGFCFAEGEIFGRVSDSISVSVPESRALKNEIDRNLDRFDIKIFGFSVNIFNSYRNYGSDCDIIEKEKSILLFGRRIPVSFSKSSVVYYNFEDVKLTDEEMVTEASDKMSHLLSERLRESTLLKIKTYGGFTDGVYGMVSDFVCMEQIGYDLPFEVKTP